MKDDDDDDDDNNNNNNNNNSMMFQLIKTNEHMALMGEMTNPNRILVAKSEEKPPFWRLEGRWIDCVIKMDRITQIL